MYIHTPGSVSMCVMDCACMHLSRCSEAAAVLSRDEASAVPHRRHFLRLDLSYETYRATIPLSELGDLRNLCYAKSRGEQAEAVNRTAAHKNDSLCKSSPIWSYYRLKNSRDVSGFVNSYSSPRFVLCVTLNRKSFLLTDLHWAHRTKWGHGMGCVRVRVCV